MFKKIAATCLILTAILAIAHVSEAAFPSKPINIVVPYNPGGGSDLSARTMAKYLSKQLGNPVVVSNKPGGGGFSEPARILKTKNLHDGYTLMLLGGINVCPEIFQKQYPYTYKDFKAVGNISISIGCLAVSKDSPYKTLKDLVEAAKKSPAPVKYSRAATGGTSHITPVLLSETYGVPLEDVPYNGDADSATALLRGEVPVSSAHPASLIPHHLSGTIRILAVFSPKRLPTIPDVPTFKEAGYELPIEALSPIGLFAPANIPADTAKIIGDAMLKAAQDPEFKDEMGKVNLMPYVVVGDKYDHHMKSFSDVIGPLIKKLGLYK